MNRPSIVLRDATIVYGLTFLFGFGAAIGGWHLGEHPDAAFILNVLSGALGFAIAAMRLPSGRPLHLGLVAVTLWIMSATNVVFGLQPPIAWVESSFTILLMALLGGTFACAVLPAIRTSSHRTRRLR